jgi:Uma2 family endonuclease
VVEVHSPSTARHDKGAKFHLYEKHGVLEYWMIDPTAEYIEVWQRKEKLERLGVFAPDDNFLSNVLGETIECKAILAE